MTKPDLGKIALIRGRDLDQKIEVDCARCGISTSKTKLI